MSKAPLPGLVAERVAQPWTANREPQTANGEPLLHPAGLEPATLWSEVIFACCL